MQKWRIVGIYGAFAMRLPRKICKNENKNIDKSVTLSYTNCNRNVIIEKYSGGVHI